MTTALIVVTPRSLAGSGLDMIPALFTEAGEKASFRLIEFLTANIHNKNTRNAYALAVRRFSRWCTKRGFRLAQLTPIHVAAYVEQMGADLAKPSVKQHLAALRMLFDYLVIGQVVPHNPAASVRGPKYKIKTGKTPVLTQAEAGALLKAIDTQTIAGLRDRALIGLMICSFARIGAALDMNVEDYCQQGKRCWFRLHEKGGKEHSVPAHHKAQEFLDAYLAAAGQLKPNLPLFRSINVRRQLTANRFVPRDALAMIKRRARAVGLGDSIGCHSLRATGITNYLENGGTIEKAQQIACHESPRTTKLYDRTSDELTLDEIQKIQI